jgi:hypothetical protein
MSSRRLCLKAAEHSSYFNTSDLVPAAWLPSLMLLRIEMVVTDRAVDVDFGLVFDVAEFDFLMPPSSSHIHEPCYLVSVVLLPICSSFSLMLYKRAETR